MTVWHRYKKYYGGESGGKHSITAVGLRKGRVVSVGHNQYLKTHPLQKACAEAVGQPERQYLHAEIDCIIKAKQPIDTLVVFRYNAKGELRKAAPCPICQIAINQAGIKQVIHS